MTEIFIDLLPTFSLLDDLDQIIIEARVDLVIGEEPGKADQEIVRYGIPESASGRLTDAIYSRSPVSYLS